MPIALHSIIELLALGVIGLGLALKLRWMGWLTILKHKRTMLKVSVHNSCTGVISVNNNMNIGCF